MTFHKYKKKVKKELKYMDVRPVIPGQWPNKTIDDGTDDDTVVNMMQLRRKPITTCVIMRTVLIGLSLIKLVATPQGLGAKQR